MGKTNLKTKVIQSVLVSNITKYDISLNVEIKGLMPLILEVQNIICISLLSCNYEAFTLSVYHNHIMTFRYIQIILYF